MSLVKETGGWGQDRDSEGKEWGLGETELFGMRRERVGWEKVGTLVQGLERKPHMYN